MADDMEIEVRCKGNFAYIRGPGLERCPGLERWIGTLHELQESDAHDHNVKHGCYLFLHKDIIKSHDNQFDGPITVDPPSPLVDFRRFKQKLKSLTIKGQAHAFEKEGATSPIPSTGQPNGDPNSEEAWISAGFIPSLRRLHPPGEEPKAAKARTEFMWPLPARTQWHGLPPWDEDVRTWLWGFRRNLGTGDEVIPQQAITDVVGFRLTVPAGTQVWANNFKIDVDFSDGPECSLILTATPKDADPPKRGHPVQHFKNLYGLSPDHLNKELMVLPVAPPLRPGEVEKQAGDIFCPGGEEEGGG
jgi:hypothetical protein